MRESSTKFRTDRHTLGMWQLPGLADFSDSPYVRGLHTLWIHSGSLYLEKPSPSTLIAKWTGATLLGLALYHKHEDEEHPNLALLVAVLSTAVVAFLCSLPTLQVLQMLLPFNIVLLLLLSILVHKGLKDRRDVGYEQDTKQHECKGQRTGT